MQTILLYERLLNSAFLLMYVRQLQTTLRRHIRIETWTDREIAIGVMLNSIPLIPGRLARQHKVLISDRAIITLRLDECRCFREAHEIQLSSALVLRVTE